MAIETLTTFLGWCLIINVGLLLFSALMIMFASKKISNIHSRMFGLEAADLRLSYFQYLGHYKIAILVFNLVPYIALKILAS